MENIILLLTFIGTLVAIVSLIFTIRNECREDWKIAHNLIMAMHEEMKDFHNRLCKIEADRK